MTSAVDIIFEGTPKQIEKMLPRTLGNIEETAQDCIDRSEKVVKMYEDVIHTLEELQEATIKEQGATSKAMEDAEVLKAQEEEAERVTKEKQKIIHAERQKLALDIARFEGQYSSYIEQASEARGGLFSEVKKLFVGEKDRGALLAAAEEARQNLREAREKADEYYKDQLKVNDELLVTVQKLAGINLENASREEVLAVMREALKALGTLKENWTNMIQFFRYMATLVKIPVGKNVNAFVANMKDAREDKLEGNDLNALMISHLRSPLQEVIEYSSLVQHLSGTYQMISREHLMPIVSSLGRLIALDKKEDKKEIEQEMKSLQGKAEQIQNKIGEIIRKNKEGHKIQVENQLKQLEEKINLKD